VAKIYDKSPIAIYDAGCIRSHAIRLMLREKGLTYRLVPMEPGRLPAELLSFNPTRELPMLSVRNDAMLFDALIIADYLDERYPEPSLYLPGPVTKGAGAKATIKLMLHRFQHIFIPAAEEVLAKGKGAAQARRQLVDAMTELASALGEQRYMLSDEVSALDCFIAALMWRLPDIGVESKARALKPLRLYLARLYSRPQFQSALDG
jgi:RNA polymerase-associated protein